MLFCFPDPHPDELLYSICARFSQRVRYRYAYATVLDLFGQKGRVAVTDLPGHLECLVDNLLQRDCYTVENLINNHTLLPFYEPFLSDVKLNRIRSKMAGDKLFTVYSFTKLLACGVLSQEWLRFCPLCVEEDRKEFGECYWHRIHQILGVEVCGKHNVFLQNSSVHKWKTRMHHKISSAEEVIKTQSPIALNLSRKFDKVLLQMANSALWLLQQQELSRVHLKQRYEDFVLDQGWFRDEVIFTIDYDRVAKEFRNNYDENTLQHFSCTFDDQLGRIWPWKFILREDTFHPIHHMIFIHFMGFDLDEFFSSQFEQTP